MKVYNVIPAKAGIQFYPSYYCRGEQKGGLVNEVRNVGILSLVFLILIGCHGDPLDTPGYREPVLVGGIIQADTTWHAADGPYRVTEDLLVPIGVTWTVEGGTEILVDWNKVIEIQGRVYFYSAEDRIVVRSEQGIWRGFRITGGYRGGNTLANVDIYNAAIAVECVDSGGVFLCDSKIISCELMGVYADSGCHAGILDCEFINDRILNFEETTAIWSVNGVMDYIHQTKINGFHCGIRIHRSSLQIPSLGSIIECDTIADCDIGILWDAQGSNMISETKFQGNQTAILITQGNPNISNNDFIKNTECIHVEGPCTPTAHQNNFIDTGQWAWWHASRDSVDATENWWGTTDADSIAALIYDQEDNSALGLVQFEPFLTSPRP